MTEINKTELQTVDQLPICWLDMTDNEPEARQMALRNGVTRFWYVQSNKTYYVPNLAVTK